MFTEWLEAEGGSFTTNLGEEEKNVQHGKMTKAWYLIRCEQKAVGKPDYTTPARLSTHLVHHFPVSAPGESWSIVSHIKGRSQGNF